MCDSGDEGPDYEKRIALWKSQYADRMKEKVPGLSSEFLELSAKAGWEGQLDVTRGNVLEALAGSAKDAADEELTCWDNDEPEAA